MQHTNGKCEHLHVHCKMCEICLLGPGPQAPTGECPWALLGDFRPKPPPPEIWTTPATETQLCPCFQPLQSYWKVGEFRISWNIQIWTFKLQATAAIWNDKFNGCNCKLFNLSEHVATARCYQIYRQLQVLFITVSQHCSSVSQTLENTTCVSLDLISSWHR